MSVYDTQTGSVRSEEDLPAYAELFDDCHSPNNELESPILPQSCVASSFTPSRTGDCDYASSEWPSDSRSSASTAAEAVTLFQVEGQFFTLVKETPSWKRRSVCEVKIVQSSTTKAMRVHNTCSRSRIWSLYTGSSIERDYEKGGVFCLRCPTTELAQAFEAAYRKTHEMNASSVSTRVMPRVRAGHGHGDINTIYSTEGKLFIINKGLRDWAVQGSCVVKFVQDMETKYVRLVAERKRTGKRRVNHHMPFAMTLCAHKICERAMLWGLSSDSLYSRDFAQGPVFCLRFANCRSRCGLRESLQESACDALGCSAESITGISAPSWRGQRGGPDADHMRSYQILR
ncbi:uncharacterized protein PHACADRAFT_248365 [Phanerochaete carnosa HHB-10118-sp]|uniref:RanBD1 domain-containing protein n=1 Tax=Phanerochaete carnosa (strain HHB-10118-sp) TaxID=650164 RepID=K5WQ84_PHACS|nr:uncharacterized protein PHACADRAFT_248365 [Phanerochaete carnosa HHB-10118-sp]EKM61640.1 hypothetical protein PHACADRAFT_248365 [Phanerochaete carnosa HHB-10118-sp]